MATKIIRNDEKQRYELIIDDKLVGYSKASTPEMHLEGARIMKVMAEEKGHTVIVEGFEI